MLFTEFGILRGKHVLVFPLMCWSRHVGAEENSGGGGGIVVLPLCWQDGTGV